MSSVAAADAPALTEAFNASADVEPFDPTFHPVEVPEILQLIEESVGAASDARGFRMQAIRRAHSDELVGYFHLRESTPQPDVVGLTMFVLRPEFRVKGYGREVAEGLLEHLAADPANRVAWARVYLRNLPALKFWTARGFTAIAEHKGERVHVEENGHASVILERKLRG